MYQCFVSAGGSGVGGGRNMAGITAVGGHRQESQASSELRLGGKKNIDTVKVLNEKSITAVISFGISVTDENLAKIE